jgi:hypothetical protein
MQTHRRLTASLLVLACSAAWAQGVPTRKPGLWEVTLLAPEGAPAQRPIAVKQCTDKAHDAEVLLSVAPGQENCKRPQVRREKGRYHIETACAVHDVPVHTRFELSGNLQSRYQGHYEVRYEKTFRPGSQTRTESRRFEGRWLSACTADMKPGDMTLPNGVMVNVLKSHDHSHGDGHGHH